MSKESKAKVDPAAAESFSVKEIRNLLDLLDKHEVSEFKLERGEDKLWLRRGGATSEVVNGGGQSPHIHINSVQPGAAPQPVAAAPEASAEPVAPATAGTTAGPAPAPVAVAPSKVFKEVSSPMVGTFYRRPAVDADPYVEVGDTVKKGDVLCIVEAMKLMNEIESDVTGTIVEIRLDDGQMVEYGEVLFRIEPS